MAKDEAEAKEFKYGVNDLAEILGIETASVRVALRKHDIDRAGRAYGWNTKSDLDAVVKLLRTPKDGEKAPAKVAAAKPVAKAVAKATPKAAPKAAKAKPAEKSEAAAA